MTAEEKLKKLYNNIPDSGAHDRICCGHYAIYADRAGNVTLSPADIDLIVNLVVERIKDATK